MLSGEFWRNYGQRTQLVCFLSLGTVFALGHHLMCQHLDGKQILEGGISIHGKTIVTDQSLISAGSNALSQLIKYCFAATAGVTFTQYFWHVIEPFVWRGPAVPSTPRVNMGSKREVLEAIDAPVAAATGNPFLPSSFKTWVTSPGLAIIALMILLLVLIPTFAPGSLRVVSLEYSVPIDCPIPSPYVPRIDPVHLYSAAVANRVIVTGSYLPIESPCGRCTYNVSFVGASLKCSPNPSYDFAGFQSPKDRMALFKGDFHEENATLTVATRDGKFPSPNAPRALDCVPYSTFYHVQVWHEATTRIEVLNVTVGEKFSTGPLRELMEPLGRALTGSIVFAMYETLDPTLTIAYTRLLRWRWVENPYTEFTWSDMEVALPSLMQNMSLSLLSGEFPSLRGGYLATSLGQCMASQVIYKYTMWRLLVIYGIGWAMAAGTLVVGFLYVSRNGQERDLSFSNLVDGLGDDAR
ncbi:hypothetical protein DFP72DRAFT_901232 [Ephemerocybe angulata]|uniref:Uncharacterized protein n=1 Tax=Ephemerocybe angulata TaxID=980116 RepID=A0A8H6HXP7_9AGAR|nr:hypothetical protein DFP72DRAFT_901232 [Tulosesus angulatus]